jgi:uncharacterized damage-inducible protein DinB
MTTELESYAALYARTQQRFAEALAGLPSAALNWRPLPATADEAQATNTPAAIVTHVAGSQRYWVGQVIGGQATERDREAEFAATAATADEVLAHLAEAGRRVASTLAGLTAEALETTVPYRDERVTRRWLLMHILLHSAEHLGELKLVRQVWEQTGRAPSG